MGGFVDPIYADTGATLPSGGTTTVAIPSGDSSGSDSSGWLSGLGDLFQGIGTAVSSSLKAANAPTLPSPGSGWVWNPATQQYYDSATGRALTSTGTLTSAGSLGGSNGVFWIILAAVAFILFRKKLTG
jgi:hypothetical protein